MIKMRIKIKKFYDNLMNYIVMSTRHYITM